MIEHATRIVGLGGSLAPDSASLTALKIALEGAEAAEAKTQLFDIATLDLPMYAPGVSDVPEAALKLGDAIYESDGLIWSSPLYHGTVSGSFKNALDWMQILSTREPPYLTNKVVGLISTAGGVQGLQAVNTMEFVVRALRGWAVPMVIPIPRAWEAFDDQGKARDPSTEQQLRALGKEVARAAGQFKTQGYCDYSLQETAAQSQSD